MADAGGAPGEKSDAVPVLCTVYSISAAVLFYDLVQQSDDLVLSGSNGSYGIDSGNAVSSSGGLHCIMKYNFEILR